MTPALVVEPLLEDNCPHGAPLLVLSGERPCLHSLCSIRAQIAQLRMLIRFLATRAAGRTGVSSMCRRWPGSGTLHLCAPGPSVLV